MNREEAKAAAKRLEELEQLLKSGHITAEQKQEYGELLNDCRSLGPEYTTVVKVNR